MASDKPLTVQLDDMKNKEWIYNDRVVTVLGSYFIEGGKEVEIYLNNGETIYTDFAKLPKLIERFRPVAEQARILQAQQDRTLNTCSNDIVSEMRDTLLAQLRAIRANPTKEVLAQSKAVNETVNQFTNLARTELEFKKMAMQIRRK